MPDKLLEIKKAILQAKEERWKKQLDFLDKFEGTLICFKFNIPSWPKNSEEISQAFESLLGEFIKFLMREKVAFSIIDQSETILGPEAFLLVNIPPANTKKQTIQFEEEGIVGRLLDLDVLARDGKPIERTIKRKCYLCDDLAINCMISQKHPPEEARKYFDKIIENYLENVVTSKQFDAKS
ncbi:MAG: citrate lyase holo-[acyl-carrier protein] synthase [Candidatus Heimdallarchaeota archaeon]|nr:citrate lyase holo-[acyl-carrier protein] synthase [Candidatus Heimdallarchaeota archaeon]